MANKPQNYFYANTHENRIIAATLMARAEKSDPHAYARAMAHMRQGLEKPHDMIEWLASRLGISADFKAVRAFLAK